jgi:hypothetical protein
MMSAIWCSSMVSYLMSAAAVLWSFSDVVREDLARALVVGVDEAAHLFVDDARRVVRHLLVLADRTVPRNTLALLFRVRIGRDGPTSPSG